MDSYIYFMRAGSGPVKIGLAFDIERRFRQAQTFNHEELILIGSFRGGYSIEKLLHQKFENFKIRGEWFRPDQSILNLAEGIFQVEYEQEENISYLILYRDYPNTETDICPFCFMKHIHGNGDGHRIAHCLTYQGFDKIKTIDGTVLERDSGYIIKSRSNKECHIPLHRNFRPSKDRIECYRNLLLCAKDKGIEYNIFNKEGRFYAEKGKRSIRWIEDNGVLCKALYQELGFNEIGITILYGVNDPEWNPMTFPDRRDNKKCNAWASGIYNFQTKDVNLNIDNKLKLYLSKKIILNQQSSQCGLSEYLQLTPYKKTAPSDLAFLKEQLA